MGKAMADLYRTLAESHKREYPEDKRTQGELEAYYRDLPTGHPSLSEAELEFAAQCTQGLLARVRRM